MITFSLARNDDPRGPYAWMTKGITHGTDATQWILITAVVEIYFKPKPPYSDEVAKELYYSWVNGPEYPAAIAYIKLWIQENEATLPPRMSEEKRAILAKVYGLLIETGRKRLARQAAEATR